MPCSRNCRLFAEASSKQAGFALLLVLWVLALLSILAAGLAADSHSGDQAALTFVALARARATADAGVTLALATLIEPGPASSWPADGRTKAVRYNDQDISVSVQDEGGKIDLNRAPQPVLAGLLLQLGVDDEAREKIVAAILGRRQAFLGDTAAFVPRGQRGNVAFALGNQAFAAVSEVRLIDGVTDDIYARMRPFVTVYTQSATINPRTAPRTVLLAVPGVMEQQADLYLTARAASVSDGDTDDEAGQATPALPGGGAYFSVNPLRAATILATATDESGVAFTREAVVTISPNTPLHPYRVLQWTQQLRPDEGLGQADPPG
jgi:general secretion pathway protein K